MKDYKRTKPKIVLITGPTGGIGKAICRRFQEMGCQLILAGRSVEKLQELELELDEGHLNRHHVGFCDMSERSSIERFFKDLPDKFRDIDVLVNNAGLGLGLDPAPECSLDDWETMIDVNNKGLVIMTRLVLAGMKRRSEGHIINIGSTAGNYPYPGGNVYCATKAFVKQFSLALRADLGGTNIRVTNIEPGMVETDFSKVRFKGDESKADAVYSGTTPLTAEDVAESVIWTTCMPAHVNINRVELMPTTQSFGPLKVERD